jgi:hypothetical protein
MDSTKKNTLTQTHQEVAEVYLELPVVEQAPLNTNIKQAQLPLVPQKVQVGSQVVEEEDQLVEHKEEEADLDQVAQVEADLHQVEEAQLQVDQAQVLPHYQTQ